MGDDFFGIGGLRERLPGAGAGNPLAVRGPSGQPNVIDPGAPATSGLPTTINRADIPGAVEERRAAEHARRGPMRARVREMLVDVNQQVEEVEAMVPPRLSAIEAIFGGVSARRRNRERTNNIKLAKLGQLMPLAVRLAELDFEISQDSASMRKFEEMASRVLFDSALRNEKTTEMQVLLDHGVKLSPSAMFNARHGAGPLGELKSVTAGDVNSHLSATEGMETLEDMEAYLRNITAAPEVTQAVRANGRQIIKEREESRRVGRQAEFLARRKEMTRQRKLIQDEIESWRGTDPDTVWELEFDVKAAGQNPDTGATIRGGGLNQPLLLFNERLVLQMPKREQYDRAAPRVGIDERRKWELYPHIYQQEILTDVPPTSPGGFMTPEEAAAAELLMQRKTDREKQDADLDVPPTSR